MKYDVKKLPDAPVVLGTWYEGFKFVEDGPQFASEVAAILDAQQTPVYYVLDLSSLHTISVEGIMRVAQAAAKSESSNFNHPQNRETILVSRKDIVKMAIEGVKNGRFGDIDIKLFSTLDSALGYIKYDS